MLVPYSKFSILFIKKICYLRDLYCEAMVVPYSKFSILFIKKICYLRDLYCEAMVVPYSKFSSIFKKRICYPRDLYCAAIKHSAWLLLLLSLLTLQCGYRLSGRGRNLPVAAQTVAIPEFVNETPRYPAGRFVSEAIRGEFLKRSRLRSSPGIDGADLLLEGRISAFETSPVAYSARGTSDRHEVRITVSVRLIDLKKNELFYEGNGLHFRETYETDAVDFFSQEAAALEKMAAKFSDAIVTAILENF